MRVENFVDKVSAAPLETRQRWWVDLNCWRTPEDFPFQLPDITGRENERADNLVWTAAWRAVNASISREEASRAWWTIELGKSEEEWRHWWENERG